MTANKTLKLSVAALVAALSAASVAAPASAQVRDARMAPVIGCDATGGKQEVGALIGAAVGAAIGSNVAKNDRGTGTAIGAVVGAGAGSAVGCQMQRNRAREEAARYEAAGYGRVTTAGGYRFASYVEPARLSRIGSDFEAATTVNLRAAPTTSARRVGSLHAGQDFEALGETRDGRWILVGRDGVGVGYVAAAYVRPQASYAYRY